jgi:hypothetical protein
MTVEEEVLMLRRHRAFLRDTLREADWELTRWQNAYLDLQRSQAMKPDGSQSEVVSENHPEENPS